MGTTSGCSLQRLRILRQSDPAFLYVRPVFFCSISSFCSFNSPCSLYTHIYTQTFTSSGIWALACMLTDMCLCITIKMLNNAPSPAAMCHPSINVPFFALWSTVQILWVASYIMAFWILSLASQHSWISSQDSWLFRQILVAADKFVLACKATCYWKATMSAHAETSWLKLYPAII